MPKKLRTAEELEEIVIELAVKYPECATLEDVAVQRESDGNGEASWTATPSCGAGADTCQRIVANVVRRLQKVYDLKA